MRLWIWLVGIVVATILVVGLTLVRLTLVGPPPTKNVKALCVEACNRALAAGTDLSAGPCLLDPMAEFTDWVCDVAHDPREPVDDLRENQCDAWHAGQARHFIEVTPDCRFIRAV
jgi:hypothetical protein